MDFSHDEKTDMFIIYVQCRRNTTEASSIYFNRYPERRQPHRTLFPRLEKNLREFGSFVQRRTHYKKQTEVAEVNVLAAVENEPTTSVRKIANECGLPKSTVNVILKKHKYHPYKPTILQGLHPGDTERRLNFCNWFLNEFRRDQSFHLNILWTDETRFTNNGIYNRHNFHHWADANPKIIKESRFQEKFGFNCWCGILGDQLIGPILYEGTLNGPRYLELLKNEVEDILDGLPLCKMINTVWQQDGAPPHNSREVQTYLNEKYGIRWIGTNGPIRWPPRSPDITPLDFFIWGHVKNLIYINTFHDVGELRQKVLEVFSSITNSQIKHCHRSIIKRITKCIELGGGHIEHVLK